MLILEGSFHDLALGRTFMPGWYACRPPGMRHGPYEFPTGCLAFEIRYYKKWEVSRDRRSGAGKK